MQRQIRQCRHWQRVEKGVAASLQRSPSRNGNVLSNIAIFRKRVMHPTRKNYQLDLFDPDDGTFEYCAVATNLPFELRALWRFMAGRGLHEKDRGTQDRTQFRYHSHTRLPANGAWQQFVIVAHNLLANFQIETGLTKRNRTLKNTNRWPLKSIRTLRFELINRLSACGHTQAGARVYSQVQGSASLATAVVKNATLAPGHARVRSPPEDEADRASDSPHVPEKSRARQSSVFTKTEIVDTNVSIIDISENIN